MKTYACLLATPAMCDPADVAGRGTADRLRPRRPEGYVPIGGDHDAAVKAVALAAFGRRWGEAATVIGGTAEFLAPEVRVPVVFRLTPLDNDAKRFSPNWSSIPTGRSLGKRICRWHRWQRQTGSTAGRKPSACRSRSSRRSGSLGGRQLAVGGEVRLVDSWTKDRRRRPADDRPLRRPTQGQRAGARGRLVRQARCGRSRVCR